MLVCLNLYELVCVYVCVSEREERREIETERGRERERV
jgi:hypothetical protein